jgi:alkylated DNA repair protein (DNA oxidative demethylase)
MPHYATPLFPEVAAAASPPGWLYLPDFLNGVEHTRLLAHIAQITFTEVRMHGVAARRTTAHFGWRYDYDARRLDQPVPIPDFLLELREQAAPLIAAAPDDLAEVLVTCYPPCATIGWHRDAPMFGPSVVGISLLSPCLMRFRQRVEDRFLRFSQVLEPGSAYVLGGPARSVWQHSIPPVDALRYSITFRTLRSAQ